MLKSVIRAQSTPFGILVLLYVSVNGSFMVGWVFGGGDGPPNGWGGPLFWGTFLLTCVGPLLVVRTLGRKLEIEGDEN